MSAEPSVAQAPVAPPGDSPLRALRVLVVDDDAMARQLLQTFLEILGCRAATAGDAEEASEKLAGGPFDVVLTDVFMPGIRATEVASVLRAAGDDREARPPAVVAVTGQALGNRRVSYLAAGFDDYLPKPVRLEELRALLLARRWTDPDDPPESARARREIVRDLDLSPELEGQAELHSFLNVLNILSGELQLLRLGLGRPTVLREPVALVDRVLAAVRAGAVDRTLLGELARVDELLTEEVEGVLAGSPEGAGLPSASDVLENLRSILAVLEVRISEHASRKEGGLAWERHSVRALTANFVHFFAAVERNSKGRYHIVRNIAAQEPEDYLVHLTIEGTGDDTILMPPVIQDVFRDLVANARKYTAPGGTISAGLSCDGTELRLAVEDTGLGIPADEIERVVEFGYRGAAVRERSTCGGGFGLTKAYLVTRRLGGRFWIESEPGRGTRITLRIPVRDRSR